MTKSTEVINRAKRQALRITKSYYRLYRPKWEVRMSNVPDNPRIGDFPCFEVMGIGSTEHEATLKASKLFLHYLK